ncbi:HAD-IIA family hydrolase [Paenibacillus doosanensis]|uniref:Acid sugar phosphatase n=1 Tax=Paenibacillus konkukensis TaxID=2020716 RepID=A0ABY4RJU3_9BACL|nr:MULTISPECIES: HAD-IIA family hydrolase [Paenibacillus]MCS7464820.1 HAD-IIA family hydrolase [Paenibacillus doosanensis]UQZ82136.1 Arabinose operon protein AraL [Paenibacillus konkukensis]
MRGYVFDLDGTIYLGDRMIEGAAEAIRILRERGDRVVFLSNKPIATRQSYAEKLTKMGIPTSVEDVLNSSLIVARYLQKRMAPGERVYVIGEQPIHDELQSHGIALTGDSVNPDYVVLSWDRQFTYDKLNIVYQAAVSGSKIIASNPDATCPLDHGQIPDTGTFIAALEAATGRSIDLVVGKPSLIAAEAAVEHLGLQYADCFMIGDRLETDIRMGNDAGMQSVLVLTGVATAEMAASSEYKPAHVIPSIKEIVRL